MVEISQKLHRCRAHLLCCFLFLAGVGLEGVQDCCPEQIYLLMNCNHSIQVTVVDMLSELVEISRNWKNKFEAHLSCAFSQVNDFRS